MYFLFHSRKNSLGTEADSCFCFALQSETNAKNHSVFAGCGKKALKMQGSKLTFSFGSQVATNRKILVASS